MRVICSALSAIGLFLMTAAGASAAFVNTPSSLNANDSVLWSQLGIPGSSILPAFTAASLNGIHVAGSFQQTTGGTVAQVCPAANCDFAGAPGFNPGDFLLWTEDANGNGTGPLSFRFTTPVRGAGLYLQLTAPGSFTASFMETAGTITTAEFPASDSTGNPLFVGALDSAADITGITVESRLVCRQVQVAAARPISRSIGCLW
jgi:hypothetical protein